MKKRMLTIFVIGIIIILFIGVNVASIYSKDEVNLISEKQYSNNIGNEVTIENITANEIVEAITAGYNLGDTFDATQERPRKSAVQRTDNEGIDYETEWGNPKTTEEMIKFVKDSGFNAIRIPVTWNHHLVDDGTGNVTIAPSFLNRVKEVVNYAYNQGMYVIINSHHDTNNFSHDQESTLAIDQTGLTWTMGVPYLLFNDESDSESQCLNVQRLWTTLANEFKDYDYHLIFEDFNEPTNITRTGGNEEQYKNLNKMQQTFVNTVRATGGNNAYRVLSLCSADWNSARNVGAMECFDITDSAKNKIIIQTHHYKKYSGDLTENTCQNLEKYYLEKGYPVILGETGFDVKNETSETNCKDLETQLKVTNKYGIKNFYWDAGEFSIFDRENLKWIDQNLINIFVNNQKSEVPQTLNNIEIETSPSKTTYIEGENFDSTGMQIRANYINKYGVKTSNIILDYKIENATNLSKEQTSITIAYNGKTVQQKIKVNKQEKTENNKISSEIVNDVANNISNETNNVIDANNKVNEIVNNENIKINTNNIINNNIQDETTKKSILPNTGEKDDTISIKIIILINIVGCIMYFKYKRIE